jgi:hypothetical protein
LKAADIARASRRMTLRTWGGAAAWGVALAALYPLHRFEINSYWAPWEFVVNLAFCVLVAWGFLLAIMLADASSPAGRPTSLRRYIAAIVLATMATVACIVVRAPHTPDAPYDVMLGRVTRAAGKTMDNKPFREVVTRGAFFTLYGSLGAIIFVVLRNARNAARALEEAELQRLAANQRLMASRLDAVRAQVDPEQTLRELGRIEALYERDRAAADALMDDLIVRLRAAIPRMRMDEEAA